MALTPKAAPRTLEWIGNQGGHLRLLDQTALPARLEFLDCRDVPALAAAIRRLVVRGAPAIGVAAAYGMVLGAQVPATSESELLAHCEAASKILAKSRPTAVNLFWALERMRRAAQSALGQGAAAIQVGLLREARLIEEQDRTACHAIGHHGATLLGDGGVLTHCNAGGLATSDYGTALAVIFAAHEAGRQLHVYADETRPLLQGARLTAWELTQREIPCTLICDSMAAQVMREGRVQAVVVGADRIAANGDAANKIGTYGVALLAAAHAIPFYVAAPASTFDRALDCGERIPIEQRDPREITHAFGLQTAPEGVGVYNPAFDVTPARLIQAVICERGIISPVTAERIAAVLDT